MTEQKLQVIPLGGLGEFGMNMTALRFGDEIIVIDSGMMFPEDELLGVDLVMPDLTFLKENQSQVKALILTHGHEDHIGAVPYFLTEIRVPVYGTAFTLALVERRLEEYELEEEPQLNIVKPKQILEIGPFKIEFIHVTHSIVSAVALAITTPLGVIIHTGDFKVDPTPTDNELFDLHTLADYGKRGVLLLLSDSTNADRPGYTESERAVQPRMEDIFSRAQRRLMISCFSSSIHRIQLVLDLSAQVRPQSGDCRTEHDIRQRDRPFVGTARDSRRRPDPAPGCHGHRRRKRSPCSFPARRASPCRRFRAWPWTTTNTSPWRRATRWC